MEPITLAILGLAVFTALGIGIAAGRLLAVGAARQRFEQTASELDALLEQNRDEVEAFRKQHILAAQERLIAAEADLMRRREALDAERRRMRQERSEQKANFAQVRQRLEARQEKLAKRSSRIENRERTLSAAADALEALQQEAATRREEADELRATVQQLARQAGRRQQELAAREQQIEELEAELTERQERLDGLIQKYLTQLESVTGIDRREALDRLVEELQSEAQLEADAMIKDLRDEARLTANREARKVILTAIQRTAATQTIENTVSVIQLQSDDMKGRIIGREGRNIRAFEAATGIEVVVDDTPEAVILSGFDPVRREIARLALEQLMLDGRIHPARIEEVVEKTRAELEDEIVEVGERAVIELRLHGVHPDLVRLIGRMKYRSSYGQNLLSHSIEVAQIASLMAAELGLDTAKARRAGLLHDIGKVIEGEIDSPHARVGMEYAQRYKEHPEVCNAIGAHHDEIEMTSPLSPIIQAADAISGARPGARREGIENYIQRLTDLENLASSFDGVQQVYAIQAGRELRVIVNHGLVNDARAAALSREISKRIEQELHYPGQIKITVIREVRNVAYAK